MLKLKSRHQAGFLFESYGNLLYEKHEYPPAGGFLCSAQSACAELFLTASFLCLKIVRKFSMINKLHGW